MQHKEDKVPSVESVPSGTDEKRAYFGIGASGFRRRETNECIVAQKQGCLNIPVLSGRLLNRVASFHVEWMSVCHSLPILTYELESLEKEGKERG